MAPVGELFVEEGGCERGASSCRMGWEVVCLQLAGDVGQSASGFFGLSGPANPRARSADDAALTVRFSKGLVKPAEFAVDGTGVGRRNRDVRHRSAGRSGGFCED
jgi:hypothetical protein